MSHNSSNEERRDMRRATHEYLTTGTYNHLLPAQYFTQQLCHNPYVNPYSHLTETNGNMQIHGYGSDGRPRFRRGRTIYSPEQLDILEHHFKKYKYPDVKHRKMISEEIGLPEERIQIWFQNRRAKDKKQVEQEAKLQKLVDEAIGTTPETSQAQSRVESGPSTSFHSPVQQLPEQEIKVEDNHFEAKLSKIDKQPMEYIDSKTVAISDQQNCQWPSGSTVPSEHQVAMQNIDQDLLFKVANILSASNDAVQMITDWSQSPHKLQTNSLEEQLRHFAEHHQRYLTQSNLPQSDLNTQ